MAKSEKSAGKAVKKVAKSAAKKVGSQAKVAKKKVEGKPAEKRIYFKQTDFPLTSLQQAQKLAAGLVDEFGGGPASPPDVAFAINVSPTSSAWSSLAGASIAYGLTDGGINASQMQLTALGRRLVAPQEEGDDIAARREAILKPSILKKFFEKYRRAKLPSEAIAINVLRGLGLPADRAATAFEIIKGNGIYAGIIRETQNGYFVNLDSPGVPAVVIASDSTEQAVDDVMGQPEALFSSGSHKPIASQEEMIDSKANRVFITHGKQRGIVAQLKDLLSYGKFEPVVSIESEATAIPVPEKVFEDMRSCGAGVLHVGAEGRYMDSYGVEHVKINDNVLIEIGAAIALYGKRVVLLVEKGVELPSNLQGLYRCEFEGGVLDYDSTMKLLRTFNQFR